MKDETPPGDPPSLVAFPSLPGMGRNSHGFDTCGDCTYFQMSKIVGAGTCHGNPPVLAMSQTGPVAVRPAVGVNDRACRHLKRFD